MMNATYGVLSNESFHKFAPLILGFLLLSREDTKYIILLFIVFLYLDINYDSIKKKKIQIVVHH